MNGPPLARVVSAQQTLDVSGRVKPASRVLQQNQALTATRAR
jgi:hypothetical protein